MNHSDQKETTRKEYFGFAVTLLYVVVAHSVDLLATFGLRTAFDWRLFRWSWGAGPAVTIPLANGVRLYPLLGLDVFKLVFWLVIPFCLSLPHLDWHYFGLARLKRVDFILLGILVLVGIVAVASVAYVPGLREYYPGLRGAKFQDKWMIFYHTFVYTLSWLVGWEFLHRYVLLRRVSVIAPRRGWLLVPLVEGAYHVVKHPAEMVGMVILSALLCFWTLRRRNGLPSMIVHFVIEMELLLFMLFV